MKVLLPILMMAMGSVASASDVGESEFMYSSDLLDQGFIPFAVSATGGASFGMFKNKDMYLCFIADTGKAQADRQRVLLAEISGESPARTVPNIPVACILTQ